MTNQITLETLAEKIYGAKLWEKGDTKRVYVNAGMNTKKVRTTAYIYEQDGEFKISVFVECPGQSMNWINQQKESAIDMVQSMIDEVIND